MSTVEKFGSESSAAATAYTDIAVDIHAFFKQHMPDVFKDGGNYKIEIELAQDENGNMSRFYEFKVTRI